VWQPEDFVFPMLMQNGLFCAALFLMLSVWNCILDARDSWKGVLPGSVALLVLTNIHTYDTLLIALVGIAFLAAMVGGKHFSAPWLGRTLVIAAGALPAVAWFVYVRGIDPVFSARADTVTISAPIWMVLLGVFPAILLAGIGLAKGGDKRAVIAGGALFVLVGTLQKTQGYRMDALWASAPIWVALLALVIALCWLYKPKSIGYGLLFAWCVAGVIAIYYPGLFQRKLAMALALPFGISAALGLQIFETARKPLIAATAVVLLGVTQFLWLSRETSMAVNNISNTTIQRVFWGSEVQEFLKFFQANAKAGDAVIAMPGVAVPDDFENPREYRVAIPDLNPVVTGWGGVKTYIGHWSETPDYLARRQRVMQDMFSPNATAESVFTTMQEAKANYILAPIGEIAAQAGVPPRDFYTGLGEVVYEGEEFVLVRYLPSP
jgi:arabinosyltransferase C